MISSNNKHKTRIKKFIFWIKIVALIYFLLGIGLYYLQEKFLFHPEALSAEYVYSFTAPFKEVNISVGKNVNLNMVQFFPKDSVRKGVILYFHGNMKNINHYAKAADNFTKNGYEVWMPDYPGFGKTTGELTEKRLYEDAIQVYKLANKIFSADSIIIYGRSLGSGIASQLASIKDCRRMILETPYPSIPDLISAYAPIYPSSFLSKFELPVKQYLQGVIAPVTIFHGDDDNIIPYRIALKLKKVLKPIDEFIAIKGGEHNDLFTFKIVIDKIDSLLKN